MSEKRTLPAITRLRKIAKLMKEVSVEMKKQSEKKVNTLRKMAEVHYGSMGTPKSEG